MDIYNLSRNFWNYAFDNPDKIKPNHSAVYFFAIEHCNRLGWKDKFGFPTTIVMEAIGIKSYNTYINTLNDLVSFGFIKMIERSKNQYSANVIAISKFNKANDKALNKALIKQPPKQLESIDSIDIQIYNDTNIQYTCTEQSSPPIKDLFQDIEIKEYLKNTTLNKKYLYLTYKFWELFKVKSDNNKTIQKAKIFSWYEEIRKIIEIDKYSLNTILAVYIFFSECQNDVYQCFWYDNINSTAGLRGKDRTDTYKLDKIIKEIEIIGNKDYNFAQLIQETTEKFNNNKALL